MTLIRLENLSRRYGTRVALATTTLAFRAGATTVVIGPSGCGKSTLLRLIVGLITPDTGQVFVNGEILTPDNARHLRHGMGYVIQDGGLFPHLTAAQNVTLLARQLQRPQRDIDNRLRVLRELVRLPGDALDRYPRELSGGQRQRVGLMRALMLDPAILLCDEPLGALDPITRHRLQEELRDIFRELGKTVVLVTHDLSEAAFFAHELVLMREGGVVQQGTLRELMEKPAEPFVTEFIRAQRPPAELYGAGA